MHSTGAASLSRSPTELEAFMRFASKFLLLAVLTLATCLPAAAQRKAGSFTLPYTTKWNNVVIPAGEYSISIYSENNEISMLRPASGKQSAVFLVPVAHEYSGSCVSSTLLMSKVQEEWSVRSVCFADTGLTLYFASPSSSESMVASVPARTLAAAGPH
jgi:hypothetical protein